MGSGEGSGVLMNLLGIVEVRSVYIRTSRQKRKSTDDFVRRDECVGREREVK